MAVYSIEYLKQRYEKLRKMFNLFLPLGICLLVLGIFGMIPTVAFYVIELIKVLDMDPSTTYITLEILRVIFLFVGLLIIDALFIIAGVAGIVIRSTLIRIKMNSTKRLIDQYHKEKEVVDNPEVVG